MSYEGAFKEMVEKAIRKDHVKRIMMLRQQDFPVDSIAAVYEMSNDEVESIIRDNKSDYEWGLKD